MTIKQKRVLWLRCAADLISNPNSNRASALCDAREWNDFGKDDLRIWPAGDKRIGEICAAQDPEQKRYLCLALAQDIEDGLA